FGWFQAHGSVCVTMEYCALGDLQTYLPSTAPLPEREVQEIAFQCLEGICYMHDNEFAHRDLKPSNILIMSCPPEQWWVKLAGFGISKRMEENLDPPSTVKGTQQFMAPELLGFGSKPGDDNKTSLYAFAADMWAFGEMIFQLTTKKPVFPKLSDLAAYASGTLRFPEVALNQVNMSSCGRNFLLFAMSSRPQIRLSAA
ncbi:kinase-like protein, partial [Rhizodiscina lignyota]